jgi:hypothetical protein
MHRLFALFLVVALSSEVLACETTPARSVEDVVFNRVTPETAELDQRLQAMYGCKYVFAMLLDSKGYEPMRLTSGAMPETPTDAGGNAVTGIVLIGFILDTTGFPSDPVVLKSADERLSEIALSHVVRLRFQPSKLNGKVVRSLGVQVYDFN